MRCHVHAIPTVRSFGIALGVLVSLSRSVDAKGEEAFVIERSSATGWATFVSTREPNGFAVSARKDSETPGARDFMREYGSLFGVQDADRELAVRNERVDFLGHRHTTFGQIHRDVPVWGGEIKVHQNSRGQFVSTNGHFRPIKPTFSVVPMIGPVEAAEHARGSSVDENSEVESAELMIVDPGWYGDPAIGAHLAYYVVRALPSTGYREACFVDANTGHILDRWSLTEFGIDRRVHDGQAGVMLPGVLVRGEGDPQAAGPADANATYDYMGDFHGYFWRAFGRDGLDDAGSPMVATVNSGAAPCPNAYWTGMQSVFCFATASDDIVAHEFLHGVTQYTANLIYQNQPGQISEAYSDIFGELIDLFNGNAAFVGPPGGPPFWPTHPTGPGNDSANSLRGAACSTAPSYTGGVRWMMAEDAGAFSSAIRDMWNPTCLNHPDRANSPLQTCDQDDNGGVHSGSGIANHAFAMLTDGKLFNGRLVTGIGPIKAGAVWYRALTTYLTVASDFEDLYHALNAAAADLIGTFPNDPRTGFPSGGMFTLSDADQVREASLAVELNTEGRCGAAIALLDPTPPFPCPGADVLFADDFENGVNGWSVATTGPSGPPSVYDWIQRSGDLPFDRAGTVWYCADPTIGNCTSQNESAVHSLISPVISIPNGVDFVRLAFSHYMASEPTFDGGNVRARVNGGAWQLIPFTAFEQNPYSAFLRPFVLNNTNPLSGQPGWTGAGGGWGTTVMDLNGFVTGGETIELRFDFGKDGCNGVDGWYIDDVVVYDCPDCDQGGLADNLDYVRSFVSGPMGPIGFSAPRSVTIPHTARAASDVTLYFTASADLGEDAERFDIRINGVPIGSVFQSGSSDCPLWPSAATIVVPASLFNLAIGNNDATIEILPTSEVGAENCGNGYVNVAVRYSVDFEDTNGNSVIDACEDCQPNGVPDPIEIGTGASADCNANLNPDECDIAAGIETDANANGIPDVCDCSIPLPPVGAPDAACPGGCYVPRNRYLSIVPPPIPPRATGVALRVRFGPMPGPADCPNVRDFSAFDGVEMWVGPEVLMAGTIPSGVFELRATPLFRDWTTVPNGVLEVSDCNIVPCATYTIDAISDYCDPFFAPAYSSGVVLSTTAIWGDLVGANSALPPNGVVDFIDIAGIVDRFSNSWGSPSRPKCDVAPNRPANGVNVNINFLDIAAVVDAFKGFSYPFLGPSAPNVCAGTP